jgi:hypothetical protein
MFGKALSIMGWPPACCVEFGVGTALPSLALLWEGAGRVLITDRYTSNKHAFDVLRMSLEKNATTWGMDGGEMGRRAVAMPHTWGVDIDELLLLPGDDDRT